MAPTSATEDYYLILEVGEDATTEQITQSYRRLALLTHPDRNPRPDATEAFQRLVGAYETLKDDLLRRQYNRIYPSLRKTRPAQTNAGPQHSKSADSAKPSSSGQAPPPRTPKPTSKPEPAPPRPKQLSEQEQIAAFVKLKAEREARWEKSRVVFEGKIAKQAEVVDKLDQRIKNLKTIRAAEKAAEACEKGWVRTIFSPLYKKKPEESEEEKSRKERDKQERMMEENLKERKLELEKIKLTKQREEMTSARKAVDACHSENDKEVMRLRQVIAVKEEKARQEKERAATAARLAREREEREAADILERAEAASRAREEERWQRNWAEMQRVQRRLAEEAQREQERVAAERRGRQRECRHDGWWPKVQGRATCPGCRQSWPYLLTCPGCSKQACPKCQGDIRTERNRKKYEGYK